MYNLNWDGANRSYTTGIDRCVAYLSDPPNSPGEPWVGVIDVSITPEGSNETIWFEGTPVKRRRVPGEMTGSIKAYSSPRILQPSIAPGVYSGSQAIPRINLTYRMSKPSTLDADNYILTLLYNLTLTPTSSGTQTNSDSPNANEISWDFAASPPGISLAPGPTAFFAFERMFVNPELLAQVENLLYGNTAAGQPVAHFPNIFALMALITEYG